MYESTRFRSVFACQTKEHTVINDKKGIQTSQEVNKKWLSHLTFLFRPTLVSHFLLLLPQHFPFIGDTVHVCVCSRSVEYVLLKLKHISSMAPLFKSTFIHPFFFIFRSKFLSSGESEHCALSIAVQYSCTCARRVFWTANFTLFCSIGTNNARHRRDTKHLRSAVARRVVWRPCLHLEQFPLEFKLKLWIIFESRWTLSVIQYTCRHSTNCTDNFRTFGHYVEDRHPSLGGAIFHRLPNIC